MSDTRWAACAEGESGFPGTLIYSTKVLSTHQVRGIDLGPRETPGSKQMGVPALGELTLQWERSSPLHRREYVEHC